MAMFDKLDYKYHCAWVYNLYSSTNICKDAWNHPKCVMVSDMMRKVLHEIPACIIQYVCTAPIAADQDRETVKSVVIQNNPECKGLIGVSVYDNKHVHFISMHTYSLEWKNKDRMVYCNFLKKMERLEFLSLNMNNEYNLSMGDVDVAD